PTAPHPPPSAPPFPYTTLFRSQLGFLPPEDPRVHGTIAAIERELMNEGFVCRYPSRHATDGLPPGEGVFLACSFWLANSLARNTDRKSTRLNSSHLVISYAVFC